MTIRAIALVAGAILAVPAAAQPWVTFQGEFRNKDVDGGKCTIEVVVDGIAEVEIWDIQGRMRTLDGQPSTWRRMDCNISMPSNPLEFRFSPQEGRGRQTLVREPQDNGGAALIRIEDPRGGKEGYKFDLEWRGEGPPIPGARRGEAGSIFSGVFGGGPAAPGPGARFPNTGGFNPPGAGFSGQVNFRGSGDGYFRDFRNSDQQLTDLEVAIDNAGNVRASLDTRQRYRMVLTGRLLLADGDRLVADMAGTDMRGTMEILLDSRNRVEELSMTGVGRNRFELRWQER